MNITRILQLRESGNVKRCHCILHHGTYDIAQHSWNMLVLLDQLWPDHPRHVYRHVMYHDVFERWTGDTPTVAKELIPELRVQLKRAEARLSKMTGIVLPHLLPKEKLWVKALDWIEFLMWCDEQIGLGYGSLQSKQLTVWEGLRAMDIPDTCREFLEKYEWRRTADDLTD